MMFGSRIISIWWFQLLQVLEIRFRYKKFQMFFWTKTR